MLKPILLAAVLLTPCALAAQPVSVDVRYRDLDLVAAAGRATLDRRLSQAVRTICGRPSADLAEMQMRRACVAEARASASSQKAIAIARAERGMQVAQAR